MIDIVAGAFIVAVVGCLLLMAGMGIMLLAEEHWMDMLGRIIGTAGVIVLVCLMITITVLALCAGGRLILKGVGL